MCCPVLNDLMGVLGRVMEDKSLMLRKARFASFQDQTLVVEAIVVSTNSFELRCFGFFGMLHD